jgi:hypothetical protein
MNSAGPNRFTVTCAWLLLWTLVAAGGWKVIRETNRATLTNLSSHETQIAEAKQNLAQELFAHEQDLRRDARNAADRRLAEFEQTLGGPLQAAFKNPDLSLREALQRAALACVPTNADVRVEVDRFTEFTVTVSSSESFFTNQMTTVARQFLPLAKPYLYSLRFSVSGTVIAELDRADIDFIDDWSRAPADRVAMLLAREVPTSAQTDAAAIDLLKQERSLSKTLAESPDLAPKMQAAQSKFNEAIRKSFDDLNAALTLSQKAVSLTDVNNHSEINARQRDLAAAAGRASAAREFWKNPRGKWSEILDNEKIFGEPFNQLRASLPLIFRDDPNLSAKVFDALDAKLESSRYFLKLAAEKVGVWRFDMEKGQFGFTDEEYAKRFRRAQDQLSQDSQALENALRTWNEFLTR